MIKLYFISSVGFIALQYIRGKIVANCSVLFFSRKNIFIHLFIFIYSFYIHVYVCMCELQLNCIYHTKEFLSTSFFSHFFFLSVNIWKFYKIYNIYLYNMYEKRAKAGRKKLWTLLPMWKHEFFCHYSIKFFHFYFHLILFNHLSLLQIFFSLIIQEYNLPFNSS